mmetsp:Transcript_84078/g.148663  ORF Transcript_84078/g.148663 Transcript_84078/m.148663 type:complete len:109 (-) Transcript_84078:245-571(-)
MNLYEGSITAVAGGYTGQCKGCEPQFAANRNTTFAGDNKNKNFCYWQSPHRTTSEAQAACEQSWSWTITNGIGHARRCTWKAAPTTTWKADSNWVTDQCGTGAQLCPP